MKLNNPLFSNADEQKLARTRYSIVIILMAVSLLGAYIVSSKYCQAMLIQGDSMLPAYHNMQLVLIDKRTEIFSRGDVVAFDCSGLDSVLVKRIVATPGDRIVIENGSLYVNGQLSGLYGEHVFDAAGILEDEIRLSENEFIVIGDNVSYSVDSRDPAVGTVNMNDIIGRVIE